jgi:diketogulonate reductase-like aldo/keto reductase
MTMPTVRFPEASGAREVPAIGQGTWRMGEGQAERRAEADALRLGIDLGMTLIDTAEMYGDGGAEEVVADAVAGRRDEVFIVSKVYPHNATWTGVPRACERSLARLRTDRIDLYLLHWRGGTPVAETVAAFEALRAAGKIGAWGVSNFDVGDMTELDGVPSGAHCASNQVLYHPGARGIDFDLVPWMRSRAMPIMAYSPVGQGGTLLRSKALVIVGARHRVTPAQVAVAWSLRAGNVIAIPKASDPAHVRANAAAATLRLTEQDVADIDAAFLPPTRKRGLEML